MTDREHVRAVALELVEVLPDDQHDEYVDRSVPLKPNRIRINGQAVLVPADSTIELHHGPQGAPTVRLSLFLSEFKMAYERLSQSGAQVVDSGTILRQLGEGRRLIIGNGQGVDVGSEPLWVGRAHTRAEMVALYEDLRRRLHDPQEADYVPPTSGDGA